MLVGFTKVYWIALLNSLTQDQRTELSSRVDATPSFGDTVPDLVGTKCINSPDDLNAKELEGLMRTIHVMIITLVDRDIVTSWRELGEAGVQIWEEDGELKKL